VTPEAEPRGILLIKNIWAPIDFPEKNVASMKWLGDDPYRVYKNRMKGVDFGIWEKAYNNTITGKSVLFIQNLNIIIQMFIG